MKRRDFLSSAISAGAAMGVTIYGLPAWAAPANRKKLIVIFLRGGADVLSFFPPRVKNPLKHPLLKERGKTQALAQSFLFNARIGGKNTPNALDLGNYPFLFHPAFEPYKNLFTGSDAAILLHTGSENVTRSHFEQQDFMESGSAKKKQGTGYLGRAASVFENKKRSSVALGGQVPYSLRGHDASLFENVDDLSSAYKVKKGSKLIVDGTGLKRSERLEFFKTSANCDGNGKMCDLADEAQKTYDQLERDLASVDDKGSVFMRQCRLAAKLAGSESNPPIITIDVGGWDTHSREAPTSPTSAFSRKVGDLGEGLAALKKDLAGEWNNTVIAVMSEFGRTVVSNPSGGTDHGRGSAMILLGGPVQRNHNSKTNGGWDLNKFDGDDASAALQVKIDFREVMAEVIHKHLGVSLGNGVATNDPKISSIFHDLHNYKNRKLIA